MRMIITSFIQYALTACNQLVRFYKQIKPIYIAKTYPSYQRTSQFTMSEYKTGSGIGSGRSDSNKAKPKMFKRCRSMPTLEVICVCQGANSFHSVISWHLVDMFLLCTQRVRLEACVCCGDTALVAVPTGHSGSCGYLQDIWPCGPSQGVVVYPPEVLVVLQDSVEAKMNSLYICIFKIAFLVSSSCLFQFFLPPQQWLLHCLAGESLFFPLNLYFLCCHQIMIIYT